VKEAIFITFKYLTLEALFSKLSVCHSKASDGQLSRGWDQSLVPAKAPIHKLETIVGKDTFFFSFRVPQQVGSLQRLLVCDRCQHAEES